MAKRLSRTARERIREEVQALIGADDGAKAAKVKKLLSCGHEDDVWPGTDSQNAVCWCCALDKATRRPSA
jgi:hypothetical protein